MTATTQLTENEATMYDGRKGMEATSPVVGYLDERVGSVLEEFKRSQIWETVRNPSTPRAMVAAIVREIYFEVCCYQPQTTRAGFLMIGSIHNSERKLMKSMLLHKWEEVEHVQWAERGYLALGGDAARLREINQSGARITPHAFAVAAVWDRLAREVEPAAYIGAEYLFESLTAEVTKLVMPQLSQLGFAADGLYFITEHATEDVKHANLFRHLADELCGRRPELIEPILYAFDCFRAVYPMPIWLAAFERATGGGFA
jgi:hypothetical protein